MSVELNEEQRRAVEMAAEDVDLDVRWEYSGRGMYGSTCVGVVGSGVGQLLKFVFRLTEYDADLAEEFVEMEPEYDSMAFDTIWYWRGVRVPQEEEVS